MRKDQLAAEAAGMELQTVDFYDIHIGFEEVTNAELRNKVNTLPTNFNLKNSQVDALREAADDALTNSAKFQEFLQSVR